MNEESFRRRYVIKIASSLIIALLNMVIQMLLPRALSMEEYGFYSYNLNVFVSVVSLANLSASNALIAKFSKRNDEIGIVDFYFKFYIVEILVLSVGVMTLYPLPVISNSFAGQTLLMVMLGLETVCVTKFLQDIIGIYDSMAIAKTTAVFQIVLKVVMCVFVAVSFIIGRLNLPVFYIGQIAITFPVAFVLLRKAYRYQKKHYTTKKEKGNIEYFKEYATFCGPLLGATAVAQVITIAMNWCLMRYSGASEQAMFGAAWQMNTLVAYVFSPYAELSKREYAVITNDEGTLKDFYISSLKRMMWLTSYFACFIGFCSSWILRIIYGPDYTGAAFVTLLIMIYTVYQAWGQLTGAFMIAREKTKLSAGLSVVGQFIGVALIFIFQIPNSFFSVSLGATGIGLTYMIGNIITANIAVVAIAKVQGWKVCESLGIQLVPVSVCSGVSFLLYKVFEIIFVEDSILWSGIKLIFSGAIYTAIVTVLVWRKPALTGLKQINLRKMLKSRK